MPIMNYKFEPIKPQEENKPQIDGTLSNLQEPQTEEIEQPIDFKIGDKTPVASGEQQDEAERKKEEVKAQILKDYGGLIKDDEIGYLYKDGMTAEDVVDKMIELQKKGIGKKSKKRAADIENRKKELGNQPPQPAQPETPQQPQPETPQQPQPETPQQPQPETPQPAQQAEAKKKEEIESRVKDLEEAIDHHIGHNRRLSNTEYKLFADMSDTEAHQKLDNATDEQLKEWATSENYTRYDKEVARLALELREAKASLGTPNTTTTPAKPAETTTSDKPTGTKKTDAELDEGKKGLDEQLDKQKKKLEDMLPDYIGKANNVDVMDYAKFYLSNSLHDLYKRGWFGNLADMPEKPTEPKEKTPEAMKEYEEQLEAYHNAKKHNDPIYGKYVAAAIKEIGERLSNIGNIYSGKEVSDTTAKQLIKDVNDKAIENMMSADNKRFEQITDTTMDTLGFGIDEKKRVNQMLNDEDIKRMYQNAATKDAQRLQLMLMKEMGDEWSKMPKQQRMNMLSVASVLFDKDVSDQDFALMCIEQPEEMAGYINQLGRLNLENKQADIIAKRLGNAMSNEQLQQLKTNGKFIVADKIFGYAKDVASAVK